MATPYAIMQPSEGPPSASGSLLGYFDDKCKGLYGVKGFALHNQEIGGEAARLREPTVQMHTAPRGSHRITVGCASELSGRPRTAESGADTPRFRGSRKLVPKRDELVDCNFPASIFIQLLYQLL